MLSASALIVNALAATLPISVMAADSATECPAPSGPVTIGLPHVYTGTEALAGQGYARATQLAIDEANAAGGIGGQEIRYQEFDEASAVTGQPDTTIAAANARQMASDSSIYVVIGGTNSSGSKAMLPIFAQAGLAMISGSSTNPDLTSPAQVQFRAADGTPTFFRTVPNDSVLGPAIARWIHENRGVTTVFFVDDGGPYGVGVGDQLEKTQAETGIQVIGRDRVDPQAADYSVLMTKINGLAPDGVAMVGGSGAGGKFANQAAGELTAVLFGADNVPDPGFIENAGPGKAEGWYGILGGPDVSTLPSAQKFVADYVARFNAQPRSQDADYYEAGVAAVAAIKEVVCSGQELTRDAVRRALPSVSFDGITGPVSFDENGDREVTAMSIWTIANDQPTYVESISFGE